MQEAFHIVFLDLSQPDDEFYLNYQEAVQFLDRLPGVALERLTSIDAVVSRLHTPDNELDLFLVWLSQDYLAHWPAVLRTVSTCHRYDELGIVVVFGFQHDVHEASRNAMMNGALAFACPFNPKVLRAYIEAEALRKKQQRVLKQLGERLRQTDNIQDMLDMVLTELANNPLVGFTRATISFIDRDGHRYLVKHQSHTARLDRHLLTRMPLRDQDGTADFDQLMWRVKQEGVVVISDLHALRADPAKLEELGWVDSGATKDVNSWIGIALQYAGDTVGIITLDHAHPQNYTQYGDRTVKFLHSFRRIVAEVLQTRLLERNTRILQDIVTGLGDNLSSEELVREILIKLKDAFTCDNCTFFRMHASMETREPSLQEWVGANDPLEPDMALPKKRTFKPGEGIAGHVLQDGISRIVPHALESEEFTSTPRLSGTELSLLVVPVMARFPVNVQNQVLGVISCYKAGMTDHFTVYDRDLVEQVAQQTATIIERTMILESTNAITKEINQLAFNKEKDDLFRRICEHALMVTTATEVVIHRIKRVEANGQAVYRSTDENYFYPTHSIHTPPRLDGQGATDVLVHMVSSGDTSTVQFSEEDGNFDKIAEELKHKGVKHVMGIPLVINQAEKDIVIGALYLNKYTAGRFSKLEAFSLELFAAQAANAISNQQFLYETKTWSDANNGLAAAIEVIATSDNPATMFRDIIFEASKLVGADFSYLALLDDQENLQFETAWPEYLLAELRSQVDKFNLGQGNPNFPMSAAKNEFQKGITGLAAELEKSILIRDIDDEKQRNSLYGRHYIDFKRNTKSELAVPIRESEEGPVIGVINLEHKEQYALTETHQRVIELFARQVAIVFQKNRWLAEARSQNDRLQKLQNAIQLIAKTNPRELLHEAVMLTCEALAAETAIIIPIRKQAETPDEETKTNGIIPALEGRVSRPRLPHVSTDKLIIEYDQIVTNNGAYQSQKQQLVRDDGYSQHVFRSQELKAFADVTNMDEHDPPLNAIMATRMKSGLCLPLLSAQQCYGVMWIHFARTWQNGAFSTEDLAIFQVYANQIALAYTNARQSIKLKRQLDEAETDITRHIDKHYQDARKQSLLYFRLGITTSLIGMILIFVGAFHILTGQQSEQTIGVVTAISGVISEAASVFVFLRVNAANERMDKYHKELFQIRLLNILLRSSEQLESDMEIVSKTEVLSEATKRWFEREPIHN